MKTFAGLKARIVSGIIAAVIALAATIAHSYSFYALLAVATVIAMREWEGLNTHKSMIFRLSGIAYLALAIFSLAWLRTHPVITGDRYEVGPYWILALFALVWTLDIAAYASGRLIGGPKIASSISPNKTWAGLAGAALASALVAYLLSPSIPNLPPIGTALGGMALAIIAQTGDFAESYFKRRAGVKDSGTLMPGHGGLLDRIDGLLAASPIFALFIWASTPG